MPAPVHGRYQVYINYYGGRRETELTTAQLTLITDEGSVNEKQETFIVPMRNAGELTLVKSFDWLLMGLPSPSMFKKTPDNFRYRVFLLINSSVQSPSQFPDRRQCTVLPAPAFYRVPALHVIV